MMTNLISAEVMKKCGEDFSQTGVTAYFKFEDVLWATHDPSRGVTAIMLKVNDGRPHSPAYLNGDVIGDYLRQTESNMRKSLHGRKNADNHRMIDAREGEEKIDQNQAATRQNESGARLEAQT